MASSRGLIWRAWAAGSLALAKRVRLRTSATAQQAKLPLGIPNGHWFEFWLLHFPSALWPGGTAGAPSPCCGFPPAGLVGVGWPQSTRRCLLSLQRGDPDPHAASLGLPGPPIGLHGCFSLLPACLDTPGAGQSHVAAQDGSLVFWGCRPRAVLMLLRVPTVSASGVGSELCWGHAQAWAGQPGLWAPGGRWRNAWPGEAEPWAA